MAKMSIKDAQINKTADELKKMMSGFSEAISKKAAVILELQ